MDQQDWQRGFGNCIVFFMRCIRNETALHTCVCVCVCQCDSGSVCGLQGDCKGAIDSLNPILVAAGGGADENRNAAQQYLLPLLQDIKRDSGCFNLWCFPSRGALNLDALGAYVFFYGLVSPPSFSL